MELNVIRKSSVVTDINPEGAKRRSSVKSLLLG